jgi:hypothetical protein
MFLIVLCSEHYACYVNYCKLTVIRDYDLLERSVRMYRRTMY